MICHEVLEKAVIEAISTEEPTTDATDGTQVTDTTDDTQGEASSSDHLAENEGGCGFVLPPIIAALIVWIPVAMPGFLKRKG